MECGWRAKLKEQVLLKMLLVGSTIAAPKMAVRYFFMIEIEDSSLVSALLEGDVNVKLASIVELGKEELSERTTMQ